MRVLLTLALLTLAGCDCNGDGRQNRGNAMNGARSKAKFKAKGKAKGKLPTIPVTVWFVDQKKLDAGDADPWISVQRDVGPRTPAKNAVWQMFKGPTPAEKEQGITLIASGADGFENFTLEGDTATLQLRGGCSNEGGALTVYDHLTKTLKEFPEVSHVRLLGPDGSTQGTEGDSRPACLEP